MEARVETGLQLFARLTNEKRNFNFDDVLFGEALQSRDVIEVSGDMSSGKTLLTTHFIARCILPVHYQEICINGCDAHAVLINTDCHFQVSKLVCIMVTIIRDADSLNMLDQRAIDVIINSCLDNLIIINCYNNDQFTITLHTLQNVLSNAPKTILLAIDSITAFYWQHRQEKGICSVGSYIRSLLNITQKQIYPFNIVTVYTRPLRCYSKNEGHKEDTFYALIEQLKYKIVLRRKSGLSEFECLVKSKQGTKLHKYTISEDGIKWIKET